MECHGCGLSHWVRPAGRSRRPLHPLRDDPTPVPRQLARPCRALTAGAGWAIWLLPIVVALVGFHLAWITLSEKGPNITISGYLRRFRV
jgi:hypothetical protein